MAKPALTGFYLAGGTSLALQIGQRKSVDLDFFGKRPFETQEILDELQDLAPIYVMSQSRNILVLNMKGVKVDFVNYRYPLVSPPVITGGMRLLSLPAPLSCRNPVPIWRRSMCQNTGIYSQGLTK